MSEDRYESREYLRELRDHIGLSTSDLAFALGVERRAIQRWQSGRSQLKPIVCLALERLAQLIDESSP